ncbi:MAG: carboxypeptidase-like regulatory domain-containing protein [Edaphobacter sp.]
MNSLRLSGLCILTVLLTPWLSLPAHAQSNSHDIAINNLPNAPASNLPDAQSCGSITGTVQDANGADIPEARVTLENAGSGTERTLTTDSSGSFKFDAVEPGRFTLIITSTGFESWTGTDLDLHTGQAYQLPLVELKVAAAVTSVQVTYTSHDLAEDQMHFEEKQRVLGIFPNFYASYIWNAAPLSAGQKFHLAIRTSIDPVTIAIPAIIAGFEQAQGHLQRLRPGHPRLRQTLRSLLHRRLHQHHVRRRHPSPPSSTRTHATSTKAPAPPSPGPSTPYPPSSSAKATTATGSPTTPTSSATSPPRASPTPTTPPPTAAPASPCPTGSSAPAQEPSAPSSRSS